MEIAMKEVEVHGGRRIWLPNSAEVVEVNGRVVVLLGTAHVSELSCAEARVAVAQLLPETLVVELCQARASLLLASEAQLKAAQTPSLATVRSCRSAGELIRRFVLPWMVAHAVRNLQVIPGSEFRAAVAAAAAVQLPVRLVLADRAIDVTLQRAYHSLSWLQLARLAWMMLTMGDIQSEDVEALRKGDVLTQAMDELAKEFPPLARVLLDERDVLLAHAILRAPGHSLLAVLGRAHLPGVRRHLEQAESLPPLPLIQSLCQPSPNPPRTRWRWTWIALAGGIGLSAALSYLRKT